MDKLSVGEHTETVNWVDGSASTGVTIKANGGSDIYYCSRRFDDNINS